MEEALHWKPTREEWLVNAITEINEEITKLELKKQEYLDEYERLTLEK